MPVTSGGNEFTFSHDGRLLALRYGGPSGNTPVAVVDVTGRTPNGRYIAYPGETFKGSSVWKLDISR